MSDSPQKVAVLACLKDAAGALSLPEISSRLSGIVPERTLRRWLVGWVEQGIVARTGRKRGTRYVYAGDQPAGGGLGFLRPVPAHRRAAVLEQIRDLWTHTSTALEGNTLTLGDTHAILGLGLTISGKPLREHQEIVGHARAIDLLYRSLAHPLDRELLFDLHRAVQTDTVHDICKPVGGWKREPNGTYAVTSDGRQVFVEYAPPDQVEPLMNEIFGFVNTLPVDAVNLDAAADIYAKVHMGIAHIHPFWDGNGRIARLVANIPLLRAGLPPLVVDQSLRREYIERLSACQIKVGKLSADTGVWPDESRLRDFSQFCRRAYAKTRVLVEHASG